MDELRSVFVSPVLAVIFVILGRWVSPVRLLFWGCLFTLFPFVICTLWAFPTMDDWCYGGSGRVGWWETQVGSYQSWSGRVASTAILSSWGLIPDRWWAVVLGYHLALFVVLIGLSTAVYFVVSLMIPSVYCGLVVGALLTSWVLSMPDLVEGIYWLSGSATYQGGMGLAIAAICFGAKATTRGSWIAAVLFAFFAPLANETVGVLACAACTVLAWHRRANAGWRWPVAVVISTTLGLAIAGFCPGNARRLEVAYQMGMPPGPHDIAGFLSAWGSNIGHFFLDRQWGLLIPVQAVTCFLPQPPKWLRFPWVIVGTMAVVSVGLAPMIWTGMLVSRGLNPLVLLFIFGLLLVSWILAGRSIWMLCGLVVVELIVHSCADAYPALPIFLWISAFVVICSLINFRLAEMRIHVAAQILTALALAIALGSPRWWMAMEDAFLIGPSYASQQMARIRLLDGMPPGSVAIVPGLTEPIPRTFQFSELSGSWEHWQNQGAAQFFGLSRVSTEPAHQKLER